ncbi:MAG: acetoin utilization deacetylase AcuC-like enzyme [Myxococcota bacterium]
MPTWHHPDYRLPLPAIAAQTGIEPRRADLALWHLLEVGALDPGDVQVPRRARWTDLARVHPPDFLEELTHPEVLARIFAADVGDLPVDQVLRTVRLGCGGTIEAARAALLRRGPTLNLLGGFHHAGVRRAGGFCAVNDIAVAVAVVRDEGFSGRVVVLDLDVHPPDGTADCLAETAWIGSLSGADWGPLPEGVDETVLAEETTDAEYLAQLDALLQRMPTAELAFVIAGGDPSIHDTLGPLKISEAALQQRDQRVARALRGVASVWLPGGGYGGRSWRPLAGTGTVLALSNTAPIPEAADPMQTRFRSLAASIPQTDLGETPWITEEDLGGMLGAWGSRDKRMLGFYSAQGIEVALLRFGVLAQIQRLGYRDLHIVLDHSGNGDRMQLLGEAAGQQQVLVETVLEKRTLDGAPGDGPVLFVHWLTLRHPLAAFSEARPALPGQETPGLGMAREASEMLARIAERLALPAVGLRPSHYHVAYASRYRFRFLDPARQGRFEALIRDMKPHPLLRVTSAIAEGQILLHGDPYTWEPDEMADWLEEGRPDTDPAWRAAVDAARDAARFSIAEL